MMHGSENTSRRAVVRATSTYKRVLDRARGMIGPGPSYVRVSPTEMARQLSSMSPEERVALAGVIGETKMLELMNHAQKGVSRAAS